LGCLEGKGEIKKNLKPINFCSIGIFHNQWKGIFGPEFFMPDKFVDKRNIIKAG